MKEKAKIYFLDDYRRKVVKANYVGEWAEYNVDKDGNPIGDPIRSGLLYDVQRKGLPKQ